MESQRALRASASLLRSTAQLQRHSVRKYQCMSPLRQRLSEKHRQISEPVLPGKPNRPQPAQAPYNFQSRRHYAKTVQQAQSRHRTGYFTFASVATFLAAGVGLYYYFQYERARMERLRIAEANKGIGRPKVGAPFVLIDHNNQVFDTEQRMKGRYALVYFGFSHCPDICPEELDKMATMLDLVEEALPTAALSGPEKAGRRGNVDLVPLFITCDPARDTPAVLKRYLAEFHPRILGLTGDYETIKKVCKDYRVYFSTPSDVKPGMDYLVDHSIYFYLMDPEGDFVEAIGRQFTPEDAAKLITGHMKDWKGRRAETS